MNFEIKGLDKIQKELDRILKEYMGEGKHGRVVPMAERKDLTTEERNDLGRLCAAEIGKTID